MARMEKNNVLYNSIRAVLEKAKNQIVRNVNITMVLTYYEMGRIIVEDEQRGKYRAEYSKKVLVQLSEQLTEEFGKGYSMSNPEYIRRFYSVYLCRIPQSLIGKSGKSNKNKTGTSPRSLNKDVEAAFMLSWTHYIQLLKIDNDEERNFYEIETCRGNWSVRELQRQFDSRLCRERFNHFADLVLPHELSRGADCCSRTNVHTKQSQSSLRNESLKRKQ